MKEISLPLPESDVHDFSRCGQLSQLTKLTNIVIRSSEGSERKVVTLPLSWSYANFTSSPSIILAQEKKI